MALRCVSDGLVAQSVEQRPFKPLVVGSSPTQPTTLKPHRIRIYTGCNALPARVTAKGMNRWQSAGNRFGNRWQPGGGQLENL